MKIKIEKLKILGTIQKHLAILGINPNESHLQHNWKILLGFFVFGSCIILNVVLIFSLENVTLMNYMEFFNVSTSLILVCHSLATIALQRDNLFGFMDGIERLVNESKTMFVWSVKQYLIEENTFLGLKFAPSSKAMYEDTNRLVEKICGILYVGCVKILPNCLIWPQILISFGKYFATDLKGDAFELPVPLW